MLKIGEFSRLTQVPAKTLRYYDDIGLLKPIYVDTTTGYRFYSLTQLPRLNRILALKTLGLSLEQIGRLLDEDLSAEQIRGMLRLRQAEIQQHLQKEQARLAYVEAKLKQIEQEGKMSAYEVVVKSVEPIRVAMARGVIPHVSGIGSFFDRLFDVVGDAIYNNQAGFDGPGIALYYDEEMRETNINIGAAIPTKGELTAGGEVSILTLPHHEMAASVVHHGPFAELGDAYHAILRWIETNGYSICGPSREVYLQYERGGDQANNVTEIQFPVTKTN